MAYSNGKTARELVSWLTDELQQHDLFYGHGTDNPESEAVYLVFECLALAYDCPEATLDEGCDEQAIKRLEDCVRRRIEQRIPAAYLLNRAWFAGLPFYVDERVLIPRSPLAELIMERCEPWLQAENVHEILEIGTGSACIAIACAHAFPQARVTATDISSDALQVAQRNLDDYQLTGRLQLVQSNVYDELPEQQYDLIISNPPYVPDSSMPGLPDEYTHEPELGLVAADQGLEIVNRILQGAVQRLSENGLLVVEVGESQPQMMQAWPQLPLIWLEFEHGGEGVFLISAEDLRRAI